MMFPLLPGNRSMKTGRVTAGYHDEQPARREELCRVLIKGTPDVISRCHQADQRLMKQLIEINTCPGGKGELP